MDAQTFRHEPVHTVLAVAKGLVVPNYVRRDPESGAWVALPGRSSDQRLVTTSWEQLVGGDQGLLGLRELEPGQAAERPDPSGRWHLVEAEEAPSRPAPSHADCYDQELRVAGHADLLMAYLVVTGVGGLIAAGFAYMLLGRMPTAHAQPLELMAQVHSFWLPLIGVSFAILVCGIIAGSRRAGWAGLVGGAASAGLGLWIWYRLGQLWLPAPVALCGLGAVLAWRGVALQLSSLRLRRLRDARG